MTPPLSRRLASEFLGTAFLVAAVVGSGIMGERLAGGNVAIALLANTISTGAALVALILTFGPISGAHLNPAVTLADAIEGGIPWREVPPYIAVQFAGGVSGAFAAHLMFGLHWYSFSTHVRSGPPREPSSPLFCFDGFQAGYTRPLRRYLSRMRRRRLAIVNARVVS